MTMNMRPSVRALLLQTRLLLCTSPLCDGSELETRPKGEHEGATARQVDDILLEIKDVKSELLHVRADRGPGPQRKVC